MISWTFLQIIGINIPVLRLRPLICWHNVWNAKGNSCEMVALAETMSSQSVEPPCPEWLRMSVQRSTDNSAKENLHFEFLDRGEKTPMEGTCWGFFLRRWNLRWSSVLVVQICFCQSSGQLSNVETTLESQMKHFLEHWGWRSTNHETSKHTIYWYTLVSIFVPFKCSNVHLSDFKNVNHPFQTKSRCHGSCSAAGPSLAVDLGR